MACPQGSGRAADADMSFCTCTQNRATASMSSTTTGDTCSSKHSLTGKVYFF